MVSMTVAFRLQRAPNRGHDSAGRRQGQLVALLGLLWIPVHRL
jgi:hypothetical protein